MYKIKTRSDNTVDRYKACLVTKGFTQEYGIDYKETFALVARLSFVHTLISVFVFRHWPLFQIDVNNVFLNGELTEEVYMELPLVSLILHVFLTKCVAYVGHYMVLSKLHELGLPSSTLPSLSMASQLVHVIQFCSFDAQIMVLPFSYYM